MRTLHGTFALPARHRCGLPASCRAIALVLVAAVVLLACKSDPDLLSRAANAELETRERGLEGLRFTIDVPKSFETKVTQSEQGIPQTVFVHPKGDLQSVPKITVTTRPKPVRFPENLVTAKPYYQPQDKSRVVETLESLNEGWLVITHGADKKRPRVRFSLDLPTRYTLECFGDYEGKRHDKALAFMKKVCTSMKVPERPE